MTPLMKLFIAAFAVYPYICLTLLTGGLLLRYSYAQEEWNARSSQFLESRMLRCGSLIFHIGILLSLGGHIVGLVLPPEALRAVGVSAQAHAQIAGLAGMLIAPMVLLGVGILLLRRIICLPVRLTTRWTDIIVLLLIGFNAATGMYQAYAAHFDAFTTIGPWVRGILTLAPAPGRMIHVPLFLQLHVLSGLTIFALLPFTRLVHIFSVPLSYVTFPFTIYRRRWGGV